MISEASPLTSRGVCTHHDSLVIFYPSSAFLPYECSVRTQSHALAAPFNAVAGESANPNPYLKQVFEHRHPEGPSRRDLSFARTRTGPAGNLGLELPRRNEPQKQRAAKQGSPKRT